MSTMTTLDVSPRAAAGKGEARRLRKTGKVPAVAYGKGQPASTIAVAPKDVIAILKSERGQNSVIQMKIGGSDVTAMIKDYSYHPISRDLEHVDFAMVALDQEVDADEPLFVTGKAAGVTLGGVLRQVYRTLPVRCVPDRIPVKLEVDVTHLKLGEAVSAQELKLDAGISIRLAAEQTIVSVVAPEREKVDEAAVAVAGAAPAAAAGAKDAKGAAPAKAAAAPAKDAAKKK